jgi:hypothetical protein
MKCREPTRLHRKSGFVEGIEPKSAFLPPFTCRRLVVCSKARPGPPTQSLGYSLVSTEESWASWPTQGDEKRVLEAQSLPLVIPTGAQRSGGTCGLAYPSWKCFSTEGSEWRNLRLLRPNELRGSKWELVNHQQ